MQHSTHVSHDSQSGQQHNPVEAPAADSGSVSISSNDNRRVTREDIELVRLYGLQFHDSYSLYP